MGFERIASTLPESGPDYESGSDFDLSAFEELSHRDDRLATLHDEIIEAIDTYVTAKQNHVALLGNTTAKMHNLEKFRKNTTKTEVDRYSAHNELIVALQSYVKQCKKLKYDTSWWDGPSGINVSANKSLRANIDDWAMGIYLEREENPAADN